MEAAPKLFPARKRASVSDARLAYFDGEFERCLEICANVRVRTITTASEVALLKARAFLRTGRPREAQSTIVETLPTHATLDASLTAQMLLASARIRQNDADTGIDLLVDAASRAGGAHFAIRSEIAFCTALGHWAKRDIDAAERYLALVDPRSDIIHARALELQAWCHTVRRDYRRSAECFRLTLLRLDECQASDRAITATAISTLATFAAELFDPDIARFVEARAQSMDWSSGISAHHYVTLEHQALFHEFAGNTIKAYQFALQATESASTVPDEVGGWALKSAIARNAGEVYSATIFAQRAQELLDTVAPRELHGEERFSMLSVAEKCAHFDPDTATELFARYRKLTPIDAMLSSSGDPRPSADERFVAGVIAQARGELDRAQSCYRKAFDMFRDLGYVRRAVIAAHAFVSISNDDEMCSYLSEHLAGITNYITESLARPADSVLALLESHCIVASLPGAQKEVVLLICLGKSNKEIAGLRNVSEQTIKNMLTKDVFRVFNVSCRAELVSTCLRGHAGRPTPHHRASGLLKSAARH